MRKFLPESQVPTLTEEREALTDGCDTEVSGRYVPNVEDTGFAEDATSTTLKSLGVVLDQRLTFHDHVTNVVKSCNYHARAIRHIRHLLTQSAAQTLACSLINSLLDYCNSLLLGVPAMSLYRLQRVQNIAARVVMDAHRRTDAKPLLRQLHWLPVRQYFRCPTFALDQPRSCHVEM